MPVRNQLHLIIERPQPQTAVSPAHQVIFIMRPAAKKPVVDSLLPALVHRERPQALNDLHEKIILSASVKLIISLAHLSTSYFCSLACIFLFLKRLSSSGICSP